MIYRAVTIVFISLGLFQTSFSQNNLQIHYGYRGSIGAAKFFPSTLDLGNNRFQVTTDYKFYFSNNALSYQDILDFQSVETIDNEFVNSFVDNLEKVNRLGIGQDILLLGVAFQLKNKRHLSFTVTDRFALDFSFKKEFIQLLWQGNKSLVNRPVDLFPSFNTRYFREYALGYNWRKNIAENKSLAIGFRLKYYQGLAAIYTDDSYIRFLTTEGGESISFYYDYQLSSSGVFDYSLTKPSGHGFGLNMGATHQINKRLSADIALNDLGSVLFKRDILVYSDRDSIFFDGASRDDIDNYSSVLDSLVEKSNYDSSFQDFRRPIGSRLFAQVSYRLNTASDKNVSRLYLTYVQGFDDIPGVSKKGRVTLGINKRLGILHLGSNVSLGGFTQFAIGGMVGIKVKGFRFGLHSDDFTGFILPKRATGAGVGFILQQSLGKVSK